MVALVRPVVRRAFEIAIEHRRPRRRRRVKILDRVTSAPLGPGRARSERCTLRMREGADWAAQENRRYRRRAWAFRHQRLLAVDARCDSDSEH
jgi:hypothetical protein